MLIIKYYGAESNFHCLLMQLVLIFSRFLQFGIYKLVNLCTMSLKTSWKFLVSISCIVCLANPYIPPPGYLSCTLLHLLALKELPQKPLGVCCVLVRASGLAERLQIPVFQPTSPCGSAHLDPLSIMSWVTLLFTFVLEYMESYHNLLLLIDLVPMGTVPCCSVVPKGS